MSGPVTDAMVEGVCRALCRLEGRDPDQWLGYRTEVRSVLEAAIAAMEQAGAPLLTERSLPAQIVDLLKSIVHEEDEDLREAASLDLLDDIIAFGMQQAAAPAAPPDEAPLPHGWRPIETCPAHVDRAILGGRYPNGLAWVNKTYRRHDGGWVGQTVDKPSHWQPVPSADTLPQPGQFEAPLPEHAPAVIRRSMTPEESALLADAMRQGGKLEYLVPAVDPKIRVSLFVQDDQGDALHVVDIPRDQSEFAILVRSGESNGAEDGRIVKMGRDLENLGVHAPAVDLGAGLREAIRIAKRWQADWQRSAEASLHATCYVAAATDILDDLEHEAALAAERKGDGR